LPGALGPIHGPPGGLELDLEKADALTISGSGLLGQDSLPIEVCAQGNEIRPLLTGSAFELRTLDLTQNLAVLDDLTGGDSKPGDAVSLCENGGMEGGDDASLYGDITN